MKRRSKIASDNKLLTLSQDFVKNRLSAAGVSYVVTSKSRYRRSVWIFVLLVTATFMAYMTYKVILEYLQYPKIVVKDDVVRRRLIFPAVTVCALSPVSRRALEKTSMAKVSKLREFLETVEHRRKQSEKRLQCTLNPMCHWSFFEERCKCKTHPCETEFCLPTEAYCACSPMMCKSNESYLQEMCVFVLRDERKLCECKANVSYEKSEKARRTSPNFLEVVETLTDTELKDIITLVGNSTVHDLIDIEDDLMPSSDDIYNYGTHLQDFLISCSYEGRRCSKENFTAYVHGKFGKCYIFNFVEASTDVEQRGLRIYNSGQTSGLHLLLNINNSDTSDLLTRELGARVVVHDPKELPPVAEYGFNIKVQDYTSVEVSQTITKRLGPPWGLCVNDGSHLPFEFSYRRYNQAVCKKVCKRTYIKEMCNCTKRSFLMGKVVEGIFESTSKFCSSRNAAESRCVQKVLRDIESEKIGCKCHPSCKEKQYRTSLSTSAVNTDFFRMVKGVKTLMRDGEKIKNFVLSAESDMLGLHVYYRALQVECFEEQPAYSWESLVANVGGNLGFFMGLSIVTFVEVCEFLWDLLLSVFRRNKIRDAAHSRVSEKVPFPQKLTTRCAALEGKMKEVELKMKEMFDTARRGYVSGEHSPTLPGRLRSRRYYRVRPTSLGRDRRIRRRRMSTSTDVSLALPHQNFCYRDLVRETAERIIENRKCPHENYGYY